MNILLALILVLFLVNIALIVFAFKKIASVYSQFRDFITPTKEGELSPAAQVGSALADMLARSLVAQIKSTFMGKQSGAVRAENAVAGDIAEDMVNQQLPLAGAVLDSFPTLKKTLRRNPALLDFALSKLSGMGGNGAVLAGKGNNSQSPKFKL